MLIIDPIVITTNVSPSFKFIFNFIRVILRNIHKSMALDNKN